MSLLDPYGLVMASPLKETVSHTALLKVWDQKVMLTSGD